MAAEDEDIIMKFTTTLLLAEANEVHNRVEHRQIIGCSIVKGWLNDLRGAIYDAQDLMGKINAKALRNKLEHGSIPCRLRNFITSKLTAKKTRKEMEEICGDLQSLLRKKVFDNGVEKIFLSRVPSTGFVEEEYSGGVFGRDDDKEAVIELLLSDKKKISVLPIVGMVGIGKTTLAQVVYNEIDDLVMGRSNFDIKLWVDVGQELGDLDLLQVRLEEKLRMKMFLLVLDDVWSMNSLQFWDKFEKSFESAKHGSKIIVTTRNEEVAKQISSLPSYHLRTMSHEDSWKLFQKYAFKRYGFNYVDPGLERIGRQIVEKCQGLPLAVKWLGHFLSNYQNTYSTDDRWKHVLESNVSSICNLHIKENDILKALWRSYYYLPSHLKQCFAHCSIFPKGYEFDKEDLIKLWMAEDLLEPQNSMGIEKVGEEYFDNLLSRFFFQHSIKGDKSECFTMHYLVHDFATYIAGKMYYRLDDRNSIKDPEEIRHCSHMEVCSYSDKKYKDLKRAKHLRTLLLQSSTQLDFNKRELESNNLALAKLLPAFKCLRALSLCNSCISKLPDSVGDLKLLKYLNLSGSKIEEIPETVCTLYNLETLLLKACRRLRKLPTKMGKLINLRHLDITSTNLKDERDVSMTTL